MKKGGLSPIKQNTNGLVKHYRNLPNTPPYVKGKATITLHTDSFLGQAIVPGPCLAMYSAIVS